MSLPIDVVFKSLTEPLEPAAALLVADELGIGAKATGINRDSGGALLKAAAAGDFKGKTKTSIEILGHREIATKRVLLIGAGKPSEHNETDWLNLGGYIWAQLTARRTESASIIAELPERSGVDAAGLAADLALGAVLRAYKFAKYQTRKAAEDTPDEKPTETTLRLVVHTADPEKAREAWVRRDAIGAGVMLARDLVNEPANVLGPVEFAERTRELAGAGIDVEILDADQLQALGMNMLLAVAQGSVRPARVVVMQWHGAKSKRARPLCFIGKGVCFDTGGISMKPAAGMEDMKGDMAGAACVTGLMLALAKRKATVNAVGFIGLVENMPSGTAIRPGDIVTSMSGQTVEILNTDAEGRLVLGDVMWYAQDRFKPKLIVDLATLTGAIIVALGKEFAGLFANDDKLATELIAAGEATGERVWRMPLDRAYDRMIDSRTADVKNIGGRNAGAITAAQFLKRFIRNTPWVHLDVAGVAMDSAKTDISQGWASGWGVRLLDRLVAEGHERDR